MKAPKGLRVEYDGVRNGKVYYNIQASRYYLFKAILKIAWQNKENPIMAFLVFMYAFYYYVKTWKERI